MGNCKTRNSFEGREYLFTLMIRPFIDFLENPIFSLQASENLCRCTAISPWSPGRGAFITIEQASHRRGRGTVMYAHMSTHNSSIACKVNQINSAVNIHH